MVRHECAEALGSIAKVCAVILKTTLSKVIFNSENQ